MLNLLIVFVVTPLVFALVIGLMAVGVMLGRREIKGSCGGLGGGQGANGVTSGCSTCTNPEPSCREAARRGQPAATTQQDRPAEDCDH